MRLGDYDALNARIDKCVGIDGLGLEPVMAIRDIKALISVMPTIDAIPVEWLKAQIRPYTGDVSDIGKTATNGTIKGIIRKWQKEQEAIA